MPRVDYFAIEEKLGEVLAASPTLQNAQIRVEGELDFQAGVSPWIGIYLERREPTAGQPLAAGMITRYSLRISVWCWVASLESIAAAIHQRDDLIGEVEVALMKDRTLGDMVSMLWLQGGELPSGRLEANGQAVYLSGGEVIVTAEVETDTN